MAYDGTWPINHVIHLLLKIITMVTPVAILATVGTHGYRSLLILQFEYFVVGTLGLVKHRIKSVVRKKLVGNVTIIFNC